MGYYSTVRILATKKVANKIFTAIKDTGSPFDEIKVSPTGNTYYFETYTKWDRYCLDTNPVVAAVMDVLDEADEKATLTEADYIYIRVGEADGDIDRRNEFAYISEGEIFTDGHSDEIDAWQDVNEDGTIQVTPAIKRLEPFWEEFKKKAKLFGIEIKAKLPEIATEPAKRKTRKKS
jgi:hypothetical protein